MAENIEVEVSGKKIAFKRLTRRIRSRIEESARRWKKQRLSDNLSFAGYDPELVADQLATLDEQPVSTNDEVCPYLRTGEGVEVALELHLVDRDDAGLIEHIENPGELILKLWDGILVPAPVEEPKEAEADPLPNGATFGPTNAPPSGQNT